MADATAIADLLRANLLEVFGQRDPELRRAAIGRIHQPGVEFSDHDGVNVGHAALDAAVEQLHARLDPSFAFREAGELQLIGDLAYLPWELGPAGEPPVVRGADIAFVRDGLIAKLYVVLTGA